MNNTEENFKKSLHKKMNLRQTTIENCDVIIYFCPIVSRAGTDINSALNHIDQVHKPVILVVLHHTFETEKVIPDSNAVVNREQTLVVDCLFYEDTGLLQCQRNENAVNTVVTHLKSHNLTSYACFNDDRARPNLSSDDYADVSRSTASLIHSEEDSLFQRFLRGHCKYVVIGIILGGVAIGAVVYLFWFCLKLKKCKMS